MHLSDRIHAIVRMAAPGHSILDVGCDHAYTAIALVESGKCPYAVASDVRPGPLASAEANIREAGVSDRIEVCLADGVSADVHERLPQGRKTLVITGMGGGLICQILDRAGDAACAFDEFVLSPQSYPDKVRHKITRMGFAILDEEMLIDEGKYYVLIRAGHAADPLPEMGDTEALYGPVLLEKRDPVLRKYLKRQMAVSDGILEALRQAGKDENDARYREVLREQEVLREAWRYYKDD